MPQSTKHDRLHDALKSHKILADTCFLMHRSFGQFLEDYAEEFQGNRILVPRKVVQELQRIEKKNDHRLQAVRDALRWIEQAISKEIAEIRGEQADDHTAVADHVISRVVEQHIAQHSILVLTNDRTLRDWIYAKKRAGCFSSRNSLLVVRFGPQNGTPHIWGQDQSQGNGQPASTFSPPPRPHRPRPSPTSNVPQPFSRTSKLEGGLETSLHAKDDVEKAGCVYLYNGQQVRLSNRLASGGEGTVYETDQPGVLCKIYHPSRLTEGARRKIELMVTRRVSHPAICWPTEAVRDSQGVFRGFLMSRASGEPLGHGLFIPTVWLSKHPNWTRKDSVRLAISILEGIEYLHRMKVLLGDINPMNILVRDANSVFFVDCDSYQVEGFPCPVGSINFVAPEIQGQDFTRFLRTAEHELFAVATLVFMIMMPGKPPYSHQGGADGAANIKKMHFPYPLGEKGSKGAPEGAWRFCWSHLNRALKEAFNASFDSASQGQPRVKVSDWLRLFKNYEFTLSKSANVFTGPKPAVGYDLCLLPQNKRYWQDDDGVVRPYSIPQDGETDLQRSVKKIASSSPRTHSSTQPSTARAPTTTTTYPSGWGQPQHTPTAPTWSGASSGGYQGPTHPASTASSQPGSAYPGAGEWYSNPLLWPVAAPVKALLEAAGIGILGAIVGTVGLGLLLMMFGNYDGFSMGAMWGAGIGTVIGLIVAGSTINKVDSGIFAAGGIGIVAGAISGGVVAGSSGWAIAGAAIGMVLGLLVRHLQIGERKAAEYMHSWWGQ